MHRLLVLTLLLLVACSRPFERSAPFKPGVFAIHLAVSTPVDGFRRATVADSKEILYIAPRAELTEAHLKKVRVERGQGDDRDERVIILVFNAEGAARLAQLTQNSINQRLALVVEGHVVSAPVIMSRIDGGIAMLNGDFTQAEAEKMVMKLAGS